MKVHEFKLQSGAKLMVTTASMADADELLSELLKCAKGIPFSQDFLAQDATHLKDLFVDAVSSPVVKNRMWKCAERATYEDVRVDKSLFDDDKLGDKAREDYLEIFWHIVEVNCKPFFARIFSLLKTRLPSADASQPPK